MPKFEFSIQELEDMAASQWLTKRERFIFNAFYRDGLSIESIAADLDINRSTVSRDLAKIRKKTVKAL